MSAFLFASDGVQAEARFPALPPKLTTGRACLRFLQGRGRERASALHRVPHVRFGPTPPLRFESIFICTFGPVLFVVLWSGNAQSSEWIVRKSVLLMAARRRFCRLCWSRASRFPALSRSSATLQRSTTLTFSRESSTRKPLQRD